MLNELDWHSILLQNHAGSKLALKEFELFLKGIENFYKHPYQRTPPDPVILWRQGSTSLYEFKTANAANAPLILIVPSLINKSYILDLKKDHSLVEYLVEAGNNVYLINWDEPLDTELCFGAEQYQARIHECLRLLHKKYQKPIVLIGYCMGGMLAISSAVSKNIKPLIKGIALLATPWDFSSFSLAKNDLYKNLRLNFNYLKFNSKKIPSRLIQLFFYLSDLNRVYQKFVSFNNIDKSNKQSEIFVAVEQWVNDGISITIPLMEEMIIDMLEHNLANNQAWQMGGQKIILQDCSLPSLVAIASKDQIVPPSSSLPLLNLLPNVTEIKVDSGHIGMIIGSKAKNDLWKPLNAWINKLY